MIVSIAFCGSIMAQHPETAFPGFDYHSQPFQKGFVGAVIIDGTPIEVIYDGWDLLEICAFVTLADGTEQQRSYGMWLNDEFVEEFGDPYPATWGIPIYYRNAGEVIHFKMFDHSRNIMYTDCVTIQDGEPVEVVTGTAYYEGWDEDPSHIIFLSFTTPDTPPTPTGIDKAIVGYNDPNVEDMWYILSSPIGSIEAGDVTTKVTNLIGNDDDDPYDFYYFNQVGDNDGKEWMNYKVTPFGFEVGKGYLYAKANGCTITFNGEAYTGEGTFELDYEEGCSDPNMQGWNLMGNPFNANVTVDRVEFGVMVDGVMVPAESNEIGPMEGIFVQALGAGEFVTFTPNETGDKSAMFSLNVTSGSKLVDRAVVRFGQGRQLPKFQLQGSTKLYIPMDGEEYSMVRSEGMGELPVSFKAMKSGSYTICINSDNVSFGYLHLIDNMTGADVDLLATPSYSFEASTTDYTSRFKLVFATGNAEDNFAFFSNGNLIVNNEGEAMLQVVDVTGRILSSESISGCASVSVDGAAGVYMVRLINGENVRVQKVVVK